MPDDRRRGNLSAGVLHGPYREQAGFAEFPGRHAHSFPKGAVEGPLAFKACVLVDFRHGLVRSPQHFTDIFDPDIIQIPVEIGPESRCENPGYTVGNDVQRSGKRG